MSSPSNYTSQPQETCSSYRLIATFSSNFLSAGIFRCFRQLCIIDGTQQDLLQQTLTNNLNSYLWRVATFTDLRCFPSGNSVCWNPEQENQHDNFASSTFKINNVLPSLYDRELCAMWQKHNVLGWLLDALTLIIHWWVLVQFEDRMERTKRQKAEIDWKQTKSAKWQECLHMCLSAC